MTAPSQQPTPPPAPAQPAPQPPQPGQPGQQVPQDPNQQHVQFPQHQVQPGTPPAPNPWTGLLDVTPQQQGAPVQQVVPGQAPGGQVGWPMAGGPGFDTQQLVDLVGRAVQSAVDRRVNQMANPQWQQAHGQPPQQGVQPGQGFTNTQASAPQVQFAPTQSGPSEADQREARMAAREYLGDRLTFGSEAERAMAVDLTAALIPTQLLMGSTPNQAALAVAQTVADRVGALRRSYEAQAVNTLRARGLLVDTPQVPAGMAGSVGVPMGGTPVSTATQQQTAAKAQRMATWAQEENAQRGWTTKPATA